MGGGSSVLTLAKRRGRPPKAVAGASSTVVRVDGRKGKRSAATIAKMKAAAKARWAAKKGVSPTPVEPATKSPRKKRTMSPEARERIAAAQRKRWAKVKG